MTMMTIRLRRLRMIMLMRRSAIWAISATRRTTMTIVAMARGFRAPHSDRTRDGQCARCCNRPLPTDFQTRIRRSCERPRPTDGMANVKNQTRNRGCVQNAWFMKKYWFLLILDQNIERLFVEERGEWFLQMDAVCLHWSD